MHPNQIHPNSQRVYIPGERYFMRETDGHVIPRSLSEYSSPPGYIPVIATSETQVSRDEEPLPRALSNLDAATVRGNQIGFDQGDQLANPRHRARGHHVSNPHAMDDHQIRDRIQAVQDEKSLPAKEKETKAEDPSEKGEPPAPARSARRRRESVSKTLSQLNVE